MMRNIFGTSFFDNNKDILEGYWMNSNKSYTTWTAFKRLTPFLKPYRFWFSIRVGGSIAFIAVNLFVAYFMQNLIDAALMGQYRDLVKFVYMMLAVIIAGVIINYITAYSSGRFTAHVMRDLRRCVLQHIEKLPVSYKEAHNSGDMVSRLSNDTPAVQGFFEIVFPELIYQPLLFIAAFIYMLLINWKLLLVSIILVPGAMLLVSVVSKPVEKYTRQLQEFLGKVNSAAQDVIGGIHILKAFNIGEVLYNKYKIEVDNSVSKSLDIEKRNSLLAPVGIMLRIIPFVLCIIYGGYLSIKGEMTAGSLMAFIQLLNYVVGPISGISGLIIDMRRNMGAAGRLFEILDQPAERTSGCSSYEINHDAVPVEFTNVSFAYDGQTRVLDKLNLRLLGGETTALVGTSGSGKSTVLKLLCGFYAPDEGNIKIYGHDLSRWELSAVREKFSLVSQDTYLFPVAIAENIAYGRPGATREEAVAAAKAANAHDFIMGLPDGYDTLAGERGVRLSGGQKQRIAIARAVLKDAPILLLDEPTSALDTESESLVQEAFSHFVGRHTILVIAHRLSTIKTADKVLVLDKGCIAEEGTHEQLIKKNGLYRQLYLKQFAKQEYLQCGNLGEEA
ncbi:MAG: ABC transporter ATP-binding protein [Ruminiclostridium sp.]|nr:ABC transporter ATP-binding protein [Ruminiclostridium sp.]